MKHKPNKNIDERYRKTQLALISELRYAAVIGILLAVILMIPFGLKLVDDYQFGKSYELANAYFKANENFKAIALYEEMRSYKESSIRIEEANARILAEIEFDKKMNGNRDAIEASINQLEAQINQQKLEGLKLESAFFLNATHIQSEFEKNKVAIPSHSKDKDKKYENYKKMNGLYNTLVHSLKTEKALDIEKLKKVNQQIEVIRQLLKNPI